MARRVYKGAVGIDITFDIVFRDTVHTIASAVVKVQKPVSGDTLEWVPDVEVTPTGAKLTYQTITGDFDEAGEYLFQPWVTTDDSRYLPCGVVSYKVYDEFEV